MSETVPVVRIKSGEPGPSSSGFVEINESDFDPQIHTLFDEQASAPAPAVKHRKERN